MGAQVVRIVLTGKATDHVGNFIDRDTLTQWLTSKGHMVCGKVDHYTDVLVASRVDTVKAREAANRGITVKSYTQFLAEQGYTRTTDSLGGRAINRADPNIPSGAGARYVGTAQPGAPNIGDIWQPGGEGAAWRWSMTPGGGRSWQRIESATEDEDFEFEENAEPPVRTAPMAFTDDTPPTSGLVKGDVWRPRNFTDVVEFIWRVEDGEGFWHINQGGQRLEHMVRDYYRNNNLPANHYRTGVGASIHNFLLAHFNALVGNWRNEEQQVMDVEAVERAEAERAALERAPRFNVLRPKRDLDL